MPEIVLESSVEPPRDDRVRIDFLFQLPEVWPSIASVWEACAADRRVRARLVLLPFLHDSHSSPLHGQHFLEAKGLAYIDGSAYDLDGDRPDVVFLQNPYDSTRPPNFATGELVRRGVRIAYVPYGLEIGGGEENLRYQYDLEVQRSAWRIFARSQRHRQMFARHCRAGDGHVVVTGHPKIDRIATSDKAAAGAELLEAISGRRAILWTPHFSVGGTGWSTWERFGDGILREFEGRPDLALIVRPHPLFFNRMRNLNLLNEASEKALRLRLARSGNIILDERSDYFPAFAASDALMADAGSFLMEYLPTGKPILYLENPQGPGLSEEGEITGSYYRGRRPEQLREFIDMVSCAKDPRREERLSRLDEFFHRFDGGIGRSIKDHVVEAFLAEPAGAKGLSAPAASPRTDAHTSAHRYWEGCACTFLASDPTYYDRQERTLRDRILPQAGKQRRVLDIGCGNGRFSFVLGEFAGSVLAFDLSPTLIEQARQEARRRECSVIEFRVSDLEAGIPPGPYGLVSCMGIMSTLIDERTFVGLCDELGRQVEPGGFLLTKESLSSGPEDRLVVSEAYCTRYRTVAAYERALTGRGFRAVDRVEMATAEGVVNHLYLWKREPAGEA
ncbi:MAG: methyltransferase domain-containing protein [Myxococcaceae bacterium]